MSNQSKIKDYVCSFESEYDRSQINYLTFNQDNTSEAFAYITTNFNTETISLKNMQANMCITRSHLKSLQNATGLYLDITDASSPDIEINPYFKNILDAEIETEQSSEISNMMRRLGNKNNINTFTKFQKYLNRYFGYVPKYKISESDPRLLLDLIYQKSNIIRTGPAFIMVNPALGAIIQESDKFIASTNQHGISMPRIYKIGAIHDIDVLIDANLKYTDNTVLIGDKTETCKTGIYYIFKKKEYTNAEEIKDCPYNDITISCNQMYAIFATKEAEKNYISFETTLKKYNFYTFLLEKLHSKFNKK